MLTRGGIGRALALAGAVLFAAGWLAATSLFAQYVAIVGSYNATYGTLGGVAVLLVWFYLTAFILLAGAELNAVYERFTRLADRKKRVYDQDLLSLLPPETAAAGAPRARSVDVTAQGWPACPNSQG